jgi:hypothetical protein
MTRRKREEQTIQWPEEKGQTMIYKTLNKTVNTEHHESH